MSEETVVEEEVKVEEPQTETTDVVEESPQTDDSPVEQEVQDRLAKMKSNMDRMAKERDEALRVKNELEQAQKEEKIKRLEDEGKLQEAAELKIADLQAKLEVLDKQNTKLNRDSMLHSQLASLNFRNERSREMAYRDIIDQLKQTEEGQWVHTSGSSSLACKSAIFNSAASCSFPSSSSLFIFSSFCACSNSFLTLRASSRSLAIRSILDFIFANLS
jgi:hypothetical protein